MASEQRTIEELENEIETLKSANRKLSKEIECYKQQTITTSPSKYKQDTSLNENDSEPEPSKNLFTLMHTKKLKDDNINLKIEVEKLYDELDSLEKEMKTCRDENTKLKDENENLLDEIDFLKSSKTNSNSNEPLADLNKSTSNTTIQFESQLESIKLENEHLKQEIEVLNIELDELIFYKANFERLNKDYEKLKQKSMESLLFSNTSSLAALNKHQSMYASINGLVSSEAKNAQMELEWIRRENEKLLLENEAIQLKLSEKKEQIDKYKKDAASNNERMQRFIEKIECGNNFQQDDLIKIQKELTCVQALLIDEKNKLDLACEQYEKKISDLTQINENLWTKSNTLEQNYEETIEILKAKDNFLNKISIEFDDLKRELAANQTELNEKTKRIGLVEQELLNKCTLAQQLDSDLNNLKEKETRNRQNYESQLLELKNVKSSLETNLSNKSDEIEQLKRDKQFILSQNESNTKKTLQDFMDLNQKHVNANEQLNKLFKENADMIILLKEKEQLLRKFEADLKQINLNCEQEMHEKKLANERVKSLEELIDQNWDKINGLTDKLQRCEMEKSKFEMKSQDIIMLEEQNKRMQLELNEKRDMISNALEKNAKLELQIIEIEKQLKEAKHRALEVDSTNNELSVLRDEILHKSDEFMKCKQELENEKCRKEKIESKLNDLKDEYKKLKIRLKRAKEDNINLQHEIIDVKNQFNGVKEKFDSVTNQNFTELEKTITMQDELNELRKKYDHLELKCVSYSQKFEILLKKYENKKSKYKSKMQRLWDYSQREKIKYKELLEHAQNDLLNAKNFLEKETELKNKQDSTYHQIIEEKRNLLATMVDKDAKMRDMKRQNVLLQSKIKLLEEEMENLHEKIDFTLKERNKLRKDGIIHATSINESLSRAISPSASSMSTQYAQLTNLNAASTQNLLEPFKASSYYSQSNTYTQSWDRFKMHELKINAQDTNTQSHFDFSSKTFDGNSNDFVNASKLLKL